MSRSDRHVAIAWRAFLVVGPLLVLALGYHALWSLRSVGRPDAHEMAVLAERVAQLADAYLARVANTTGVIAIAPEVVALATTSSGVKRDDEDVRLKDHEWTQQAPRERTPKPDPYRALGETRASLFLKDVTETVATTYREILVADRHGRLLAASNRTEDYDQADDDWWPADLTQFGASCRHLASQCATVLDVGWDAGARGHGFAVVLPVVSRDGDAVGVLKAVIDRRELEALLGIASLGRDLEVALVSRDGTRVLSQKPFFPDLGAADTGEPDPRLVALGELGPGAETAVPLHRSDKEGSARVYVRSLSGLRGREWAVAVTDLAADTQGAVMPFAGWTALTATLFGIAVFALKFRTSDAAVAAPAQVVGPEGAA